jgi:hypothetical protein
MIEIIKTTVDSNSELILKLNKDENDRIKKSSALMTYSNLRTASKNASNRQKPKLIN